MSELDSLIHGEDEHQGEEEQLPSRGKEVLLWQRTPPSAVEPKLNSDGEPFEKFTRYSKEGVFTKQELGKLKFVRWQLQQEILKAQGGVLLPAAKK